MNYLDFILSAQKYGEGRGVTSICSAHPFVLEAALRFGQVHHTPVLIEATCNQVNQYGGYTGMTPVDFARFAGEAARRLGLRRDYLLLGGDHLGPLVWANEPAESAMRKAKEMVRAYALAGFDKIHLDCSMPCAGDRELPPEVVAQRAAELAAVAEAACAGAGLAGPRYVIGTEVPAAGGAKAGEGALRVTDAEDAATTVDVTQRAFAARGLQAAWERVVALVVQPGVEFGDETVHEYDRAAVRGLVQFIENRPGLVYEAHSTDYQRRAALRALVEDHFAILKVGPALTFAFREAVFALAEIEEMVCDVHSGIREHLDGAMLADPSHWQKHYDGDEKRQRLARRFSFSDRIRYYWNTADAQGALGRLLGNLDERPLPLALLSQYLPRQYEKVRNGELDNRPRQILLGGVMDVLEDYRVACGGVHPDLHG